MQDFTKLEERVTALMAGTYTLQRWDGKTMVYVKDGIRISVKQPKGTLKQTLPAVELMQMETLKVEL